MKNKGITLIALVITIIVLIILAGVTINAILGDNGVIAKAKEAKQKMQIASEKEKIELIILDLYTEKVEQGNGKVTVDNAIDKLIEKGITTEGDSTRPEEGETTGNVTLDSGNNYNLTEDEDTVKVDYNGPSDNIKPQLEIRKDTDSPTGKVTITIIATDNVNGIKQILKDGTEINHYPEGTKTVTEIVDITENGSYEIKVISGIDKETSQTITINNIDKSAPIVRYELSPEEGSYGKEVTITIIAEDSNGIASITTPEGTITKENLTKVNDTTYQTTYTVNANGTYHFSVTDGNGNKLEDYTVTIENIDKEGPEITGINKEVGKDTAQVIVTEVRDSGVGTVGTEYRYWISKDDTWTEYTTDATYTFTGLTEGTEYTIKIQAKDSLENEGEVYITKAIPIDGGVKKYMKLTTGRTLVNTKLVYGSEVLGYNSSTNLQWQIFYIDAEDDDRVYLIAKDYAMPPVKMATPCPIEGGDSRWPKAYRFVGNFGSPSILGDYTGDIPETEFTRAFLSEFVGVSASNKEPLQAINYMLDQTIWAEYRNDGKADWAFGGPTLPLFLKSYNDVCKVQVDYKKVNEGYQMKRGGGSFDIYIKDAGDVNLQKGIYFMGDNGTNSNSAQGMWIASPGSNNGEGLVRAELWGYVNGMYVSQPCYGFRPVIALHTDVQFTDNGDGTYTIN